MPPYPGCFHVYYIDRDALVEFLWLGKEVTDRGHFTKVLATG